MTSTHPSRIRDCTSCETMMSNKEMERYYFEKFRAMYALPTGEVAYQDMPDVVIDGPRRIGIEITGFYLSDGTSPASEQVQALRRQKVVKQAERMHGSGGGEDVSVTVEFNGRHPIQDVQDLAKRLSALIKATPDSGRISARLYRDVPELRLVYVHRPRRQTDGFSASPLSGSLRRPWKVQGDRRLGLMSEVRLREIVREKELKIAKYTPCDADWLLVVADSADAAQEQEIRVEGIEIFSGVFEKIIVYEPHLEHILEFNCRPTE